MSLERVSIALTKPRGQLIDSGQESYNQTMQMLPTINKNLDNLATGNHHQSDVNLTKSYQLFNNPVHNKSVSVINLA